MNLRRKILPRRFPDKPGNLLTLAITKFSQPPPTPGCKGSHGKRPGRAGSLLCRHCRKDKRGKAAPCVRNPNRRDVPCDPCKKKGFTAEECGPRTWGPHGANETFDPDPIFTAPPSIPHNFVQMRHLAMQGWRIPIPQQNTHPQPGTQNGQTFFQTPYVSNLISWRTDSL